MIGLLRLIIASATLGVAHGTTSSSVKPPSVGSLLDGIRILKCKREEHPPIGMIIACEIMPKNRVMMVSHEAMKSLCELCEWQRDLGIIKIKGMP